MVSTRVLPERHNPLLAPTDATGIDILIQRRRLGQTYLVVKTGIAGVTNATKADNMGSFDYAHLRVPLPKDLTGSGIFKQNRNTVFPESYFLMRRSSDGLVSSTGMFKAAFPWASFAEEEIERKYHKTFPGADPEEIAGSVWISPEEALALSDEYSMRHWVEALLDPAPIEKGNKDKKDVPIQTPPKFDLANAVPAFLPPQTDVYAGPARSTRSVSPSKIATPKRRLATPRKARTTRNGAKSDILKAEELFPSVASTPGTVLQREILNGVTPIKAVDSETEKIDDDEVKAGNVRIQVEETVETKGNVETTTTNVKVDVPHDHPALPEPEDPTKMIEEAKRMVQEAQKLDGVSSNAIQTKRKVEETIEEEEVIEARPSKLAKMYTTEQKLIKEKVTRRAMVGVAVMGAIVGAFQYFAL